jgi:hypothetical protein
MYEHRFCLGIMLKEWILPRLAKRGPDLDRRSQGTLCTMHVFFIWKTISKCSGTSQGPGSWLPTIQQPSSQRQPAFAAIYAWVSMSVKQATDLAFPHTSDYSVSTKV